MPAAGGAPGFRGQKRADVAQGGSILAGVGGRYASALFELAQESGVVDAVGAQLDTFGAMIEGSDDLQRLIRNPVFTAEEQVAAVGALLAKAKVTGLAANFIGLVARKRRLFALPGMIAAYRQLVADAKGVVRAEVTVAEAPSAAQLKDIAAALKEAAGKEVTIDLKIDPSLIGGLVVKMGSKMVDASLKTKLNSIRIAMKEVG
jgi:F-type H+-transporting ATPase subunit delta